MPWVIREDWEAPDAPDIYFTRAYLEMHRGPATRPLLFEYTEGVRRYRLPFLESDIEAWFPGAGRVRDMETAYGYGGSWTDSAEPGFLASAMAALDEACRDRGIIAGFLRYHPLLGNQDLTPGFSVVDDRPTVWVDLGDADIWMNQVSQKNRNMIRKAEKAGLTFRADPEFRGLDGFRGLYAETMERLGAHASYRFGDAYFAGLRRALSGKGFLAECLLRGETVAAAIIMTWGSLGHYHLSGSRSAFRHLAPGNLMLYGAIGELRAKGLSRFHLGGGLGADPADPLFRFKQSFSGNAARFHFGKKIFDPPAYARLRQAWERANPGGASAAGAKVLFYRF